jgi:hypothetical protein
VISESRQKQLQQSVTAEADKDDHPEIRDLLAQRKKQRGGAFPAVLPALDSSAEGMLPFTWVDAVPGGYAMSL